MAEMFEVKVTPHLFDCDGGIGRKGCSVPMEAPTVVYRDKSNKMKYCYDCGAEMARQFGSYVEYSNDAWRFLTMLWQHRSMVALSYLLESTDPSMKNFAEGMRGL